MALEINRMEESYEDQCDGCLRKIGVGEKYLSNIESCCGGGCCRRLCLDCVIWAGSMIIREDTTLPIERPENPALTKAIERLWK